MEATLNNRTDVLNTHIVSSESEPLYFVETDLGYLRSRFNRTTTFLRLGVVTLSSADLERPVVGAIHWKEKAFEIQGEKKLIDDVRRLEGKWYRTKKRIWKWGDNRQEYIGEYLDSLRGPQEWIISRDLALSDPSKVCARLQTPLLPSMFKASSPVKLTIDSDAMLQDELFIILALIYSEVKRQDITTSSAIGAQTAAASAAAAAGVAAADAV